MEIKASDLKPCPTCEDLPDLLEVSQWFLFGCIPCDRVTHGGAKEFPSHSLLGWNNRNWFREKCNKVSQYRVIKKYSKRQRVLKGLAAFIKLQEELSNV